MPLARLATVHPLHGSCLTHESWHLDCHQHEQLRSRADWRCEICRQVGKGLVTDHDYAVGRFAIRGTLCKRCNNTFISRVDSGEYPIDPVSLRYIQNPWHLARDGRMLDYDPIVHVSVDQLSVHDQQTIADLHPRREMGIFTSNIRDCQPQFEHPGVAACVAAGDIRPVLRLIRMALIWRRPDIDIAECGAHVPGGHAAERLVAA